MYFASKMLLKSMKIIMTSRTRQKDDFATKRGPLARKGSLHEPFESKKRFRGLKQLVKNVEIAAFSNNLQQFFTILADRPDYILEVILLHFL